MHLSSQSDQIQTSLLVGSSNKLLSDRSDDDSSLGTRLWKRFSSSLLSLVVARQHWESGLFSCNLYLKSGGLGLEQVKMPQSSLFLLSFIIFLKKKKKSWIATSLWLVFRVLKKLILTFFWGQLFHCFYEGEKFWRSLFHILADKIKCITFGKGRH